MAGFVAAFLLGCWIGSPGQIERQAAEMPQKDEKKVETALPRQRAPKAKKPAIDAFESLLSHVSPPKLAAGTGCIQGRVVTDEGTGLAGVLIRVQARPTYDSRRDWLRNSPPKETPLPEKVLRLVAWKKKGELPFKDCFTDADGCFELTSLPDLHYSVEAFCEGYKIEPESWSDAWHIRTESRVEFAARAIFKIPIKVVFSDGTSPEEAYLKGRLEEEKDDQDLSYPYSYKIGQKWTRKNPYLVCTKGICRIQAYEGYPWNYVSDVENCLLRMGMPVPELTLVLKRRQSILGRVILPEDVLPNTKVNVYLKPVPPGAEVGAESLSEGSEDRKYTYLRSPYMGFCFSDVFAGTYLLGAGWNSNSMAVTKTVSVQDGPVTENLVMPQPDLQDCVVLRVFDPLGRMVKNAKIKTELAEGDHRGYVFTNVIGKRDGSYWIVFGKTSFEDPLDDGRDVRYEFQVRTGSYGTKTVIWGPDDPRKIDVELALPVRLGLVISDYVDNPHRDRIWIQARQGNVRKELKEWDIREDGTATFVGLQPGPCTVTIMPMSIHNWYPLARKQHQFNLKPGLNRETLTLPELYTVLLKTEEVNPNDYVCAELFALDFVEPLDPYDKFAGSRRSAHRKSGINQEGVAIFRDIPQGKYRVKVLYAYGPGEMIISVTENTTVEYRPKRYNAYKVGYSDNDDEPNDNYTEYGFQKGDLIVGAEGRRFLSLSDVDHLSWIARTKSKIDLTVIRNGREMLISLYYDELRKFLQNNWPQKVRYK